MKTVFAFAFLLIGAKGQAQAVAHFTAPLKKAYSLIVQLRFKEARSIVDQQQLEDPNNKTSYYLEGAMLCGEIFAREDRERFEEEGDTFEHIIDELETVNEDEPFRDLFLGEMHLAQATLNGKFGNTLKAAWQFYKAYNLLTKNDKRFPDFYPNYLPLGVLYAGIGSLPDDYRSLASLLGFQGNVKEGMSMVKAAFLHLSFDPDLDFYRPYAGFIYSYLQYQLGSDQRQVSPVSLGLDVKSSSFLIFLQAQIDLSNGNAKEALQWLKNRPKGDQYLDFNYLNYLQGKIELGLAPDDALKSFQLYLKNKSSNVYVKSTYRYLAWIYLLKDDEIHFDAMKEEIFREGDDETGADRQALLEAQTGFNKILIRSRVLFDVGKLEEARQNLDANPMEECCTSARDKAEYYYRYGRILDESGDKQKALEYYKNALKVDAAGQTYSRGNSALMAGLIYESQGNADQAKSYFKQALQFSGFPFYEGIQQKAKAGLSRL